MNRTQFPQTLAARAKKPVAGLAACALALSLVSFGKADAPPGRYILTAETVTDNVTGLMWQRNIDSVLRAWADSGTYCANLPLAGHDDWRLPSLNEFQTIIDESRANPAMDPTAFQGAPFGSQYW